MPISSYSSIVLCGNMVLKKGFDILETPIDGNGENQ